MAERLHMGHTLLEGYVTLRPLRQLLSRQSLNSLGIEIQWSGKHPKIIVIPWWGFTFKLFTVVTKPLMKQEICTFFWLFVQFLSVCSFCNIRLQIHLTQILFLKDLTGAVGKPENYITLFTGDPFLHSQEVRERDKNEKT